MSLRFGKLRWRDDRQKYELPVYENQKRKRLLFDTKREASEFMAGDEIDPDDRTIESGIQFYFKNVSEKKSRTSKKNEKRYFNLMFHFLTEVEGLTTLKQVKYTHVYALQNWLGEPREYDGRPMKWSKTTVNRAFNSIKDFFLFWVRDGELLSSPCEALRQLEAAGNTRRPMTPEEFLLAFGRAPDWFKPAMAFMHLTASAPSSVSRLKWSDVDFQNGIVTLTRFKGKSGRLRRIPFPITNELRALLSTQERRKHGHVFSNEHGMPLSNDWCSDVGNKAIKGAGLEGVVLYSIRHALASELTDANVNLEIIRRLMGHANIRTTQGYAKPKTESLSAALTLVRGEKCHQTATRDVDASASGELLVGLSR